MCQIRVNLRRWACLLAALACLLALLPLPAHAAGAASKVVRVGWYEDAYNINLSERRAKSVVDYLVENGISRDRLQPHGYGKSRPKTVTKRIARLYPQFKEGDILTEEFIKTLSEEDQQAADQINRRTEFSVLSLTYNMK